MLTIYGIPNCDSCRKARKWLDGNNIGYRFHDLRADGIDEKDVTRWLNVARWQKLLNTRSTTWRGLSDSDRRDVDEKKAAALLLEHVTLVKRPVAEKGSTILIGFDADLYRVLLD